MRGQPVHSQGGETTSPQGIGGEAEEVTDDQAGPHEHSAHRGGNPASQKTQNVLSDHLIKYL
jgi:hypothetical protein